MINELVGVNAFIPAFTNSNVTLLVKMNDLPVDVVDGTLRSFDGVPPGPEWLDFEAS
jgi:hypothetical protein